MAAGKGTVHNVREVAELLDVCVPQVRIMIRRGDLRKEPVRDHFVVPHAAMLEYLGRRIRHFQSQIREVKNASNQASTRRKGCDRGRSGSRGID